MRWDEIKDEWATMTRRIRADWRNGSASVDLPQRERGATPVHSEASADRGSSDKGAAFGSLPTTQ